MKFAYKLCGYFIGIIVLTSLLFGCGSRGVVIEVGNKSNSDLKYIVLSGAGFSNTISKLNDGETTSVHIFPNGESSLTVQFEVNGKEFNLPQDTYFEGNGEYHVSVDIEPDFKVAVEVKI